MERELAKSYVRYGMQPIDRYSRKLCFQFFPIHLFLSVLALLLCHDLIFSITVWVALAADFVTSMIYRAKWSVICGFLSVATQLSFLAIVMDQYAYTMYRMDNLFVRYVYVIGIGLQLLSVFVSIGIVVALAKKFRGDKTPRKNSALIAGIVGSAIYAGGSICITVFFKDIPFSIVSNIYFALANIIVIFLGYVIVAACSRVYLIRKYHLNFDEKEEEAKQEDE